MYGKYRWRACVNVLINPHSNGCLSIYTKTNILIIKTTTHYIDAAKNENELVYMTVASIINSITVITAAAAVAVAGLDVGAVVVPVLPLASSSASLAPSRYW